MGKNHLLLLQAINANSSRITPAVAGVNDYHHSRIGHRGQITRHRGQLGPERPGTVGPVARVEAAEFARHWLPGAVVSSGTSLIETPLGGSRMIPLLFLSARQSGLLGPSLRVIWVEGGVVSLLGNIPGNNAVAIVREIVWPQPAGHRRIR